MTTTLTVAVPRLRGASVPAVEGLRADLAFCHPAIAGLEGIDATSGTVAAQVDASADREEVTAAILDVARASLASFALVPVTPPLWQRTAGQRGPGARAVTTFVERHVHPLGRGQYALSGPAAALRSFFDQRFEALARTLGAEPWHLPSVEVTEDLVARTGYLTSHPQFVTFGYHLPPHYQQVKAFAGDAARRGLAWPEEEHRLQPAGFILAPVVCHNVFRALRGTRLPGARIITARGCCYRHEGFRFAPLLRQWEFSMRELVLLGSPETIRAVRQHALELTQALCAELDLEAHLEVATDPFFVASAASPRTFQALQATKLELRLGIEGEETTAGASFNLHGRHFARPMEITGEAGADLETACVGWGLERWMAAFVARHSADSDAWPVVGL